MNEIKIITPETEQTQVSKYSDMLAGIEMDRPVDAIFVNSPLKDYDISPRYNDFTLPVVGLGYIATYAKSQGFNVAVLDAESLGLGITEIASLINATNPRWVGLNLLAPTYRHSVNILRQINPEISVMLGGHQAKAMPTEIIQDEQIFRVDSMILGEGEYRASAILGDVSRRDGMPEMCWRGKSGETLRSKLFFETMSNYWLAPDVNTLPFVNRVFLPQDPFTTPTGSKKANLVGSRGCPYDCSFCGAAISANPDITIRTRDPQNILDEMNYLYETYCVTEFRFIDDLFLASPQFMKVCLPQFRQAGVKERYKWDATGRINILSRASDSILDLMVEAGCNEVALGIESGSERVLNYMGKRINPTMIKDAVEKLVRRGINVKGYFILGFPTETQAELEETVQIVRDLWKISDKHSGEFRCSVFEFRPYPGTPEWHRLIATGRYTPRQLLEYEQVDLTHQGVVSQMLDRDEFNFSVNIQFGEAPVSLVRKSLSEIMIQQKLRLSGGEA